jgi:hypothetical protein
MYLRNIKGVTGGCTVKCVVVYNQLDTFLTSERTGNFSAKQLYGSDGCLAYEFYWAQSEILYSSV